MSMQSMEPQLTLGKLQVSKHIQTFWLLFSSVVFLCAAFSIRSTHCPGRCFCASEHRMWGKVMSKEMGNFRSMFVSTSGTKTGWSKDSWWMMQHGTVMLCKISTEKNSVISPWLFSMNGQRLKCHACHNMSEDQIDPQSCTEKKKKSTANMTAVTTVTIPPVCRFCMKSSWTWKWQNNEWLLQQLHFQLLHFSLLKDGFKWFKAWRCQVHETHSSSIVDGRDFAPGKENKTIQLKLALL